MQSKRLLLLLALLAGAEAAYIAWSAVPGKRAAATEISVLPGKSYSLLVDDERFPIAAGPGERIAIAVFPSKLPPEPMPGRVIIKFGEDQEPMARVKESRFRFYFDEPAAMRDFYRSENLGALRGKTDWETALNSLKWARRQFEPGTPSDYPPQDAPSLLKGLRSGQVRGFCAQYCYVLVQALQALGLKARYVTLKGHEIAEVWLREEGRWAALDPMNAAYFTNADGGKLSALEIARAPAGARIVSAVYKGGPEALLSHFSGLLFWLRNDLYSRRINVYDLAKYRVRAVLTPEELASVRSGELFTVYPEEFYSPPSGH